MSREREFWVDYVKVFSCVLVVLGHFFQSMVKANILPDNNLYQWFNTTIYYFHVPLFFICSGYLYQRYSKVESFGTWGRNVVKKAITLGIPYFVFSFATWVLKTVFSGAVNNEIGGLADTLVMHPASPYWYLYILFLIFLVTPTLKSRKGAITLMGLALIAKAIRIIGGYSVLQIYAISKFTENWIWFAIGMTIALFGVDRLKRTLTGLVIAAIFLALSIFLYKNGNGWVSFGLGVLACIAVIMIVSGSHKMRMLDYMASYTMPVFLMHTLFAAPVRTLLIKVGIGNAAIQVVAGILISFIGPVIAMEIMRLIKIDWIVNPRRLLRKR